MAGKTKAATTPTGRVKLSDAAVYLGYCERTVWRFISRGVLTNSEANRGRGKHSRLWWDEVIALAEQGEDAAKRIAEARRERIKAKRLAAR